MRNKGSLFSISGVLGSAALISVSAGATAGDWRFEKGVNASAVYTDNVNLVSTGKESDLNALLTPHFSLQGKGGRLNMNITGALEINSQGGNSDSVNPRLQADANAELIERIAFIDLNATATQNVIDPLAVSGTDNLSNNNNRTTTYNYRISPYLKSRFGGVADTELRYTYNGINHSEGSVGDTSSEMVNLNINSGSDFTRITWGVDASHRTTDDDQGRVSELNALDLSLGYRVNRRWQINGSIGSESNDFNSTRSSNDGSRWDVGALWTPNPRTELDFGIGERFFGSTKRLSFSHKSRRSVLTATYTHDLTDVTSLLSQQAVFLVVDAFGNPIPNPVTGLPQFELKDIATLNTSTFVDERLALSYTLQGRRSTLTLNGNMSDQTYQDSSREVSNVGLGATFSRNLSGQVSGDVGLDWNQWEESGTGSRETETWRLTAGISQQLGTKTHLRFNYSYTDYESNQSGQSYDENKLTLTLSHTL